MAKEPKIILKGKIVEVLGGGQFKVLVFENNVEITANVSGKILGQRRQILKDDTVEVELSPYDVTRGRIIYRLT